MCWIICMRILFLFFDILGFLSPEALYLYHVTSVKESTGDLGFD